MWREHLQLNKTNKTKTFTMNAIGPWLSADIQAQIEPPLIPLIKAELEEHKSSNTTKVDIRIKFSQIVSETYKVNMCTFNNGQPE